MLGRSRSRLGYYTGLLGRSRSGPSYYAGADLGRAARLAAIWAGGGAGSDLGRPRGRRGGADRRPTRWSIEDDTRRRSLIEAAATHAQEPTTACAQQPVVARATEMAAARAHQGGS
jgi:hypothetical protein